MKSFFLSLLIASSPLFCGVKEEIARVQKELTKAKGAEEKSLCHLKLALAYLEDQEQDKAFQSFLLALETADGKKRGLQSLEEKTLSEEALTLYLEGEEGSHAVAEEILKRYEKMSESHPEYGELCALVATAWGNCGSYDRFFRLFYSSYDPESFLAYKTRGILTLRLAIHGKTEEERTVQKEAARKLLHKALERNERDPSLYRLLVVMAKERKDKSLIVKYLEKLAASNSKVPRGDILFYVKECVDVGRKDLGYTIVKGAKERYSYSRAIQSAEEMLK